MKYFESLFQRSSHDASNLNSNFRPCWPLQVRWVQKGCVVGGQSARWSHLTVTMWWKTGDWMNVNELERSIMRGHILNSNEQSQLPLSAYTHAHLGNDESRPREGWRRGDFPRLHERTSRGRSPTDRSWRWGLEIEVRSACRISRQNFEFWILNFKKLFRY